MRNMSAFQQSLYLRGYYRTQRPDLNGLDYITWSRRLKEGDEYLNLLREALNKETFRVYMTSSGFHRAANLKVPKISLHSA